MAKAALGKPVPAFKLQATSGKTITEKDLTGKNTVLYFYPKDDTPGCTQEGQDFRDEIKQFVKLNTQVIGVSRDTVKSHESFKAKYDFPFELLSDPDETLCTVFDVMQMKNMYGKQVRGVERSTFLIDSKGVLRREWRKVKVQDHVNEVLAAVTEL
ncbi:MAG TPA: peroxiredoxin [Gammaproteobacteria bacterium]|nr:peroxiredoxin [Gammaproteobacteria bacterium]